MTKDEWVTIHFRVEHWNIYLKICSTAKNHPDRTFSSESWITLDDVASDNPIPTDDKIMETINQSTQEDCGGAPGPILIRRFVVVREGPESSLCLGIHTYVSHLNVEMTVFATKHAAIPRTVMLSRL